MRGGFLELQASAGEAGPTLTGTSEASIIPPTVRDIYQGAPYFNGLGESLILMLSGIISTVGATPGTLTFNVKFGAIKVWAQATPTLDTSLTNKSWKLFLPLSQYAVGASAAMRGIGDFAYNSKALLLPDTAPANGSAFDGASPGLIDVTAQFSVTGNSLTVQQYHLLLPQR